MIVTHAIKTVKLTKYYGNKRGIVDLDLTVPQGAFYGFIGPNAITISPRAAITSMGMQPSKT